MFSDLFVKLKDRRDRWIIYGDIIDALSEGSKGMMNRANIGFRQKENYIDEMSKAGLLVAYEENGRKKYHVTYKGIDLKKRLIELLKLTN